MIIKNLNNINIHQDYKGNKIIHLLIIKNNNKLLKEYLKKGYDLNLIDINKNTPYHLLLQQFYDIDKFKLLINKNTCWNNKNIHDDSILNLIFNDENIFNQLSDYHHYFMNKDIFPVDPKNSQLLLKNFTLKNILKFIDLIDFENSLFEILNNNKINLIDSITKIINKKQSVININDNFGNNFLGRYVIHFRNILDQKKDMIDQLINLGFDPDYKNPITNFHLFKFLNNNIIDRSYLLKYYKSHKINSNIIDVNGNNLGLYFLLYYKKMGFKPDKLLNTILQDSDKNHFNLDNLSINKILKNYSGNEKINLDLIKVDFSKTNYFSARLDDIILFFNILENKYKNLHVPKFELNLNSREIDFDSNLISLPTDLPINLDDLPFVVSFLDSDTYYVNPYLNLLIQKLIKKFPNDNAIVFLSLKDSDGGLHANILFYDFKNKTITRFEPYGNTFILDKDLDNILEEELTWNLKFKYIPPNQYINGSGLQAISDDTNVLYEKPGDFGGFCLAWCLWFVEMKMKNNAISNNDLVIKSLKKIIKNNTLLNYIRSYGNKITDEKFKIYQKINIPKNYWTNLTLNNDSKEKLLTFFAKYLNL